MDHVSSLLQGLGNGGVFAALALAIVLTYRSSGVINFATGAIALYAAYTYAALRDGKLLVLIPGLPDSIDLGTRLGFAPAALLALVLSAVLGAVLYLVVFRPLRDAPQLARAVASLGVLVVIQATMSIRLGSDPVSVKPLFPAERWELGAVRLLSDRFYLALAVVALTLVLVALYRFTRIGLATRAVAESQTGAFVSGVSPDRVALLNWVISAVVAGMAGILIAPLTPLTPITYTLFVIPALAAAVVGSFQLLGITVAAGIIIGMLQSEATSLATRYSWMPQSGAAELVPLIVILVTLVIRRTPSMRVSPARHPLGRAPRPRGLTVPLVCGSAVGLVALAVTSGTWRASVIETMIFCIIGLSLVVVTGYAGQVSLAQLALAGVGAFTLSGLTQSWGVPFPLAPILAALVATVVGVVIGIPALRVRGLMLGIVTLAFAYAIEAVWFRNSSIVGSNGATVAAPSLFGFDLSIGSGADFPRLPFGIMCLVTLAGVAWGVARLRQSSLGSAMLAVRANERSAAGLGVDVVRVKVVSFAIASFIAGLGGSLLAYRRGVVTFSSFTAFGGLTILSTAYLAGVTSVWGGILAGILVASGILFAVTERWINLGDWFPVISGVGLIITMIVNPEGLAAIGHRLSDRLRRSSRAVPALAGTGVVGGVPIATVDPRSGATPAAAPARTTTLDVRALTVRYGGVTAVDDVTLTVPPGTVTGLIGPNGAGKTSIIDAITGFAPATGQVLLGGSPLDGLAPHKRVRRGLGRTFQSIELHDDLSVEENLQVAVQGSRRASDGGDGLERACALLGIDGLLDRPAGELSQGERQLVSMARACASRPEVLLLDEPAAGLDPTESAWLGERIRTVASSGTGVLLVDHDIALVLAICDHIYVLDFGRLIAEGDPATIRADRAVAEAYLGTSGTHQDEPAAPSHGEEPTTEPDEAVAR